MKDVQARAKEIAQQYIDIAQARCVQAGIALSPRQEAIVRGAIMNLLEPQIKQRLTEFVTALEDDAKRIAELRQMDTDDLADLLIDGVWSTMTIGTEESAITEMAAERLHLLSA